MKRIYPYIAIFAVTIFLIFCYLFFKSYRRANDRNYTFERFALPKAFITKTVSPFDSLNLKGSTLYSLDGYLIAKDYSSAAKEECTLMNAKGEILEQMTIPEKSISIAAYMDSCLYFIPDTGIKVIDFKNKRSVPNTLFYAKKIINAVSITDKKFLTIGVDADKKDTPVSFSVSARRSTQIRDLENIKTLSKDDYKTYNEKLLAYSGVFMKAFGYITYSFSHIPFVYVFNEKGKFITSIKTKDNVPFPSIMRYKDFYIFERGKSFNSNIGSFVLGDNVCVLSYHAPSKGEYVIDCYNLHKGDYTGSIYIENGHGLQNAEINDVTYIADHILINSNGTVTALKCEK